MYMEKFLRELGITEKGHYTTKGSYVIDLDDSEDYGRYYSKFDKNELIEEDEDSSVMTIHTSNIVFRSDDFQFTLIADFDQDTYRLVCVELKGDK